MNQVLLQHSEWLIQPEALRSIAAASASYRGGPLPQPDSPNPLLSVEDGIATISIEGPILRKPGLFARVIMGATDSEEIGAAIREANDRTDIKAVMLNIDSPGGTVAGTPELANAVASLNEHKPVYAFSSGLMASAAYWIASQARAIYATPSAQVGSIGVVQAVVDDSAALDKEGIKVEVFSVGKYKAMGAPGNPLTNDQRELIQSNLAEIAGEFHAAVLAKGRAIPPDAMEGQTFSGRQAQRYNLAGMVPDRAEAMRRLRVYHAAVDTGSRAMTTALEDQLLEARTQVDDLTRDFHAQTELLTEATTAADSLRSEVEWLAAQIDTLKAERDSAIGESSALQTNLTELKASQTDFDRKLQLEVARVVASTGTMFPASITAAGDHLQPAKTETLQDLVAQYEQIVSDHKPTEAAAFYQQHLAKHFTR